MKIRENKYHSHYGGLLTKAEIGSQVRISGWVENIRDHGGIIFVDVRDMYGTLQIVSNEEHFFDGLTRESSIMVQGTLRTRAEDDYNPRLSTGEIELLVDTLEVLGKCKSVLPFEVMTSKESNEEVRLKYRYLDLRNPKVKENILFRNRVIRSIRDFMEEEDFMEIQTPILTASSPEGARDFIIPSRKFKGKFYSLPQAPQQFKQLLMCAGFDKYFQIAPCFRDEDARRDRVYGEFYQLDFEMSFAEEEDVLAIGEKLFTHIFEKFSSKKIVSQPFPRITYREAMEKYGTDKPDLRNPLQLVDLTEEFQDTEFRPFRGVPVKGIKVENIASKTNSWFNEIVAYAESIGMPGIGYFKVNEDLSFAGPIDKFLTDSERQALIEKAELTPNSVLFFIADRTKAYYYSSLIRDELGRKLELIDPNVFAFCIVHDFPMYEWSEELDQFIFTHNPFSMPKGGLESLKEMSPLEIVAYQYDFVCNGIEMASGAVRNHDIEIMKKAFEIAGYSEEELQERFKALYTAFQYGAPPHAGMAPGIDRMLMLLLDEESIRETIAFPMSASGQDAMMGCPNTVSEAQLRETHIKLRD